MANLMSHSSDLLQVRIYSKRLGIDFGQEIFLCQNLKKIRVSANSRWKIFANCTQCLDVDVVRIPETVSTLCYEYQEGCIILPFQNGVNVIHCITSPFQLCEFMFAGGNGGQAVIDIGKKVSMIPSSLRAV